MVVALYVSGHGFGHASRITALIDALAARAPTARFVVRTAAPPRLFDLASTRAIDVQRFEADPGVVQRDDMTFDDEATVRRAEEFYRGFDRLADEEAARLAALGAAFVVGDIPPLAFAAADRAGLPSVAIGNFTWDWIYASQPRFAREAPDVVPVAARAYARASLALRLPTHGGFDTTPAIRDIPFLVRRASRTRGEVRDALGLGGNRPVVLASFSWPGVRPPYDELARSGAFALITPERAPAGIRHEELVAAADVVISKPGYGIIAECAAHGAALVYTTRGSFVEHDMLVEQMPRYVRCRRLAYADLVAGRWDVAIDAVLAQSAPASRPDVDGAEVAARSINALVSRT